MNIKCKSNHVNKQPKNFYGGTESGQGDTTAPFLCGETSTLHHTHVCQEARMK